MSESPRLPSLAGRRLLVVEDDSDTRELIRQALTLHDASVTCTSSVAEGIAALKSELPDLIVSDLLLPYESGFEFIRHVRASPELRSLPVLALTGLGSPEDQERVFEAGFDAYLTKPVAVDELITVVQKLIE